MSHVVKVESIQEDGRTLEITPAGGIRTTAPLVPRGELLELAGQDYVVVAVRQALAGWGRADWEAVTTYLVDEAVNDTEFEPDAIDGSPAVTELIRDVWGDQLLDAVKNQGEM